MANELLEKVEDLCQRIDSYTEKEISVKSKVKTDSYITKIKKLISMIERVENSPDIPKANDEEGIEEDISEENISEENKYNPYSEDFYYKARLEKLGGNINRLIDELKAEDELGYRNAYIIKEIEKYIPELNKKKKTSLWDKIKNIFK